MEYQTPGVYIREVDSGPKPIAAAATSIPGFLGVFLHNPKVDAIAITGTDGNRTVQGKLLPALIDSSGNFTSAKAEEASTALVQAFNFRRTQVKDLKQLLELNGHKPTFGKGAAGKTKVTIGKEAFEVPEASLSVEGKIVTDDEKAINDLFESIGQTFALDKPKPKTAADILKVYGYEFQAAKSSSLAPSYSVAPFPVTNKSEFFRWLQSYFAQYLVETSSLEDLGIKGGSTPDAAADAVFAALTDNDLVKDKFKAWLSQPTVFNFVTGVNGFYDNGGGKCYVYLQGTQDTECSIRENQADKLGLYAFDDCDDMALHVAPGLTRNQQKEMLEHCETRKDRFAILDGDPVSTGDMDIPASDKGYGAIYVPWFKITKPSWFDGEAPLNVPSHLRRKMTRLNKNEVFVPPSGHIAGVFARIDNERGVHKAPANELVNGITGVSQVINKLEQGQYNDRGINVVRVFKDRGTRIWGARTLATKSDPSWKYINVRRLFIMCEQSILAGAQWAVFEPNDKFLWSKISRDVRAFLMRVWRSGALFGNTPEEAFYVKCDAETNPRYLIDAGQVNVQIGICPVKPAEFVVFSIGQWDGGALIEE